MQGWGKNYSIREYYTGWMWMGLVTKTETEDYEQ